jgi:hypothetical protein
MPDSMEAFMRWFTAWSWRRQQPTRRPPPKHFFEPEKQAEDDVPPRGCAWFDSSHELMRGLVVLEVPVVWAAAIAPFDQTLSA